MSLPLTRFKRVVFVASALLAALWICELCFAPIRSGPRFRKQIAITFDDGPNPIFTASVVKLLERYHARGTFFVLGRNVLLYPRELDGIAANHQIANHGLSHQALYELSFAEQVREIRLTENILKQRGIKTTALFRPPYGKASLRLRHWLQGQGYKTVLWSHQGSVADYQRLNPSQLAQKLIAAIKPGAILVLHDGEGLRPETLEALQLVLQYAQANQYEMVTVDELLSQRG